MVEQLFEQWAENPTGDPEGVTVLYDAVWEYMQQKLPLDACLELDDIIGSYVYENLKHGFAAGFKTGVNLMKEV